MYKLIKASSDNNGKYIGGKLYDLPEDFWDDYDQIEHRYLLQDDYVSNFGDAYIIYRPDTSADKFSLYYTYDNLLADLCDRMAIKDGVDVVAYPNHIEVIAYYGSSKEVAYLYPISTQKAAELAEIIDNADFDEKTVIENEIAQYTYNGASVEDVLKSWV